MNQEEFCGLIVVWGVTINTILIVLFGQDIQDRVRTWS